jgi:hypothetical protein
MKKCDKRNGHISSKLHLIYISSNNDRHPVTKTFTPLHYTCQHLVIFINYNNNSVWNYKVLCFQ